MNPNNQTSSSESDSVGNRLDRLKWTPFHTRITIVLGIGWLLDSFEVSVIGNVLGVLKKIWMVGLMIGALFFGYLADRFGRRKLFIATLLLYSTATVISAFSPGYYFFLVFRFLTAIGVGAEYSAINAAIGELIPAKVRGRATSLVMNFWPLGGILAAFVSLFLLNLFPESIGWRIAFGLGAIVALFTIWARKALPESPRWLVARGRHAEANKIMAQIEAREYRFEPIPARGKETETVNFFQQLYALMRYHPWRLALGTLLDFTEAVGYYGIFAFLPLIVLPRIHIANAQVPWFFLIGNVGAFAGGLLVAALLDKAGRKFTVTFSYVMAAGAMMIMGWATITGSAGGVLAAFIVVNFFATMSWVSAYPTFSEIFPTNLRSTGIGFSVAIGHLGSGLALLLPVMIAKDLSNTSIIISFAVLGGSYLVGALVMVPWIFWGPEGRGKSLEFLGGEHSTPRNRLSLAKRNLANDHR